ncbi:MAG: hypothetical protein U0746_01120 [Gemmataceae bacterium]
MSVRTALATLTILVLALVIGCGHRAAPLAGVTGVVTFRGMPLANGLIVFTPDDDSGCHGSCAYGEIGVDGRFVLFTDGTRGAAIGWHRISVAGLDVYGPKLPARFLDPQGSGLRAKVVAGTENVIDFQLEGS